MKTVYFLSILILLAGCGPSGEQTIATAEAAQAQTHTAEPTTTPTITPTSTPAYTPTPEFSDIYESESLGVSVRYPAGWKVSENEIEITFEDADKKIVVIFFPAEVQDRYNGNPVTALASFIQFSGIAMPDKEHVHLTTLNDSQYAFGVYSTPGEALGFNNPSPLFAAMHFTDEFTIYSEMYAPAGSEDSDRQQFEMVLGSLPPPVPVYLVATPTLKPNVTTNLPELPEGIHWQGVENIDFALPIPDGWYVTFTRSYESYQGGLNEYDYEYLITQEDPDLVGKFSQELGMMTVLTWKDNDIDFDTVADAFDTNIKNDPKINKIIDEQSYERNNVLVYQLYAEGINPDIPEDDPIHEKTLFLALIINKEMNTVYILNFESAAKNWDQEWETGQIMMNALLELLGG